MIAHGRNAGRAQVAMENIRTATPGAEVEMILADLSEMAQVRRFAKDVAGRTDKIDLLVNNAGFTPSRRVETIDGMEQCFAANHMADQYTVAPAQSCGTGRANHQHRLGCP